ncbi:MAG: outer membrane cobalamin receptor [Crocinitomicaceae bacterium]|jgi:outer membrane cobalamin receptor
MKTILSIAAVMFLSLTWAQDTIREGTLRGIVRDDKGATIPGAAVIYKKDVTRGVNADDDGNYELQVPAGEARIICRYSDMITDTFMVTILAGQTVNRDITLKTFVLDVSGVEIKVGKFDKPFEDQTVSMEIIRPEMIENKVTRSIETALDQTPGLNILDGEPQIRGGSGFTFGVGSKVAVIVDDMPMLSGDGGRPEWGFIPVENIHQIEVVKGASSVLSGSSALSGAIHIRTAFPGLEPKTKINVYSGFYNKPSIEGADWWTNTPLITGANFLHSRRIKNLDLVIGGNVNYDHGYMGPPVTDTLVYEDTVSNFNEQQMSSKRVRLNFNLRYRSKKYRGLNYGINGNVMYAKSNLAFAWLNDSSGLYQAYPGAVFLQDQFIFNIDPFLNFFTETDGKHHFRMRFLRSENKMTAGQSNESSTIYGDYMFAKSYKTIKDFDFIGGLTGTYTNSFANLYAGAGSPHNDLLNVSAYSQIEKKFKETLNLSVGGRLEYFQLNDTLTALKPIFRAGTSIKIYEETYLRASYGQGYRFPTITERYIRTGVGNFGVFPNPEIKAESSWNAEVGLKQGIKLGNVYGYFDIAGFWQEYQNTIEYLFGFWGDPIVDPTQLYGFKFMNTGNSRVLGLDISFSGKAMLGKKAELTFMTGYNYIVPKTLSPDLIYATDLIGREYSYNKTSLDSASQILKYRSLHNVKGDFEITFNDKFAVGFSVKYFSKMVNMDGVIEEFEISTVGPFIQNIRYMDYFAEHRFGNLIFDARVSYNINEKHKVAVVSANITNRSYSLRPLKIEAPRTIMFQYTFKLDKNKST